MTTLLVKPLGYTRLAQTPILRSTYITEYIEPALGIPMPSTMLGALGAALGITLDNAKVQKDPLLGLNVLIESLANKLGVEDDEPIIEGPLVSVEIKNRRYTTVPIHGKTGTLLFDVHALVDSWENIITVYDQAIVAIAKQISITGVQLRDSRGEPDKTVIPGRTFRRTFTWFYTPHGEPVKITYIYAVPHSRTNLRVDTIIRLGGEMRNAVIRLTEDYDNELLSKLTWPCKAGEGYYMLLSPWPLIPRVENALWFDNPSLFEQPVPQEIIGIPSPKGLSILVTRLGLGFSEVANKRRPQLLALPPGSIVRLNTMDCKKGSILYNLFRAGYASLLPLRL